MEFLNAVDLGDQLRAARISNRNAYTNAEISLEQYRAQEVLINQIVALHIRWYKSIAPSFDELSFVGSASDGGAVF